MGKFLENNFGEFWNSYLSGHELNEDWGGLPDQVRTQPERKVYWISPFGSPKFEDSLVQLFKKFGNYDNVVSAIDGALGLAKSARDVGFYNNDKYIIITLKFQYDYMDKLIKGPNFNVVEFSSKSLLDGEGYQHIGFINCTKEDVDMYIQTKKFNL